jgi:adenosylcobinamide-GDP ribazoletransferase
MTEVTMTSLIVAFQFLTIFPAIIKRMFTAEEMGRAAGFFPLVGVVLGALLYGINYAARLIFPDSVSATLMLFAWIFLTRAFHLDGFMDTCDGLFGGWNPERRLEIMKDSRVGAFGVAGGVLILLTKYSALSSSTNIFAALILATTLGRWSLPLLIYFFPYARENGLGYEMKRNTRWVELLLATFIAGITAWLLLGWLGLVLMLGAGIIAIFFGLYVMRLLPGLTGDIYGAATILVETVTLIFFTVHL